MLLENKNVVIYGAGGAVGGAVARAFAREGAKLFLAGRTLVRVEAVARGISTAGGTAEAAQVNALDEQAVEEHLGKVAEKAGTIDLHARGTGKSFEEVLADSGSGTLLGRLPWVAEVANAATLMASDYASAMTGVIANVTCGYIIN